MLIYLFVCNFLVLHSVLQMDIGQQPIVYVQISVYVIFYDDSTAIYICYIQASVSVANLCTDELPKKIYTLLLFIMLRI